jgi:hypothetical protein
MTKQIESFQPSIAEVADAQRVAARVDDPTLAKAWAAEEKAFGTLIEGAKALALLNSAGVAAVLAFVQALIGKDAAMSHALKPFWLLSFSVFLIAALSASVVSLAISHRMIARLAGLRSNGAATAAALLTVAAVGFAVGALSFGIGLASKV